MSDALHALPTLTEPGGALERCVQSQAVLHSAVAQIVDWTCMRDGVALRAERQHSTYVLSLVAAGACHVHDGSWHATLDPVNALLHRPGSVYRTSHPYGCIDSGWNIAYDRDVAEEILERAGITDRHWRRRTLTVTTRPALLGLRQFVTVQRQRRGLLIGTLELEELAVELLEAIALRCHPPTRGCRLATGREHHRVTEAARQHLNEHYTTPLTLKRLACDVGTSPAHLCRIFKQNVGMTLREYLHRLRLQAALGVSAQSRSSLAHAALQSGFCNQAHMTSVCTRVFGSPPGSIRKRWTHPQ